MAKEHWIFHLEESIDPQTFALEHNLRYVKRVLDFDVFEADPQTFRTLHMNAAAMEQVKFSQRQEKKRQYTRAQDPLYPGQWHLHGPCEYSVLADQVPNGRSGRGVTIAIVDDGLQYTHPDLAQNYKAHLSYDFNGHRTSPMPRSSDGHGTSAAGVAAAAANNGHCGRGIAPRASLAGIRLIAGPAYDYVEAEAMTYKNQEIDIYSCSWGPYDGGQDLSGPGPVMQRAFASGVKTGRHGKGSIFVWAAGNGAQNHDNVNYDGYANNIYTIAIGAIDNSGQRAYYSEKGSPLMAVVPSSGAGKGIVTTDLVGHAGYSGGECTAEFGGTSSACPLAAGLVALALEARADLTWRDVQHVIVKAAEKIHPEDPDWANGHSHSYGFGLLRAPALVREAQRHQLVPKQKFVHSAKIYANSQNANFNGFFKVAQVPISGDLTFVEHVQVYVDAQHSRRGDLLIELVSPSGVVSKLTEKHFDRHSGRFTWVYTSVRHWGEHHRANQQWQVKFKDASGRGNSGHWNFVQIILSGY